MPKGKTQNQHRRLTPLDLDVTANDAEVRAAYRKKLFKWHPDKGGCHDAIKYLHMARDILLCENAREAYENYGLAAGQAALVKERRADLDDAHERAECGLECQAAS
jgi:DnaJ-class molecular chaperone